MRTRRRAASTDARSRCAFAQHGPEPKLRASGQFDGGSSIGPGVLARRDRTIVPAPSHVNGYIRVRAESLEAAQRFLAGNPNYDAGGTIEVRELLHSSTQAA